MTDLRKVAEQALEAFEKIYEGCGEVKKDNLSKQSNELATLVRKDCIPQIEALRQALAEPEREPLVWMNKHGHVASFQNEEYKDPLYTAPPKREWVGLTDEEIDAAVKSCNTLDTYKYFRAIEAKLKEKNA